MAEAIGSERAELVAELVTGLRAAAVDATPTACRSVVDDLARWLRGEADPAAARAALGDERGRRVARMLVYERLKRAGYVPSPEAGRLLDVFFAVGPAFAKPGPCG